MASSPPRLFVLASRPRALCALAGVIVVFGAAMLPAIVAMADHGASVVEWESAGSVARMQEILEQWGAAGEAAAWWQLALDVPFVIGFGLFFAGACTAVSRRAGETGSPRLQRIAAAGAWLGPLAAVADLLQDISLALILGGQVTEPWPQISALTGPFITACIAIAALLAVAGAVATRKPAAAEAADPEAPG
jgi:hypothetical protein